MAAWDDGSIGAKVDATVRRFDRTSRWAIAMTVAVLALETAILWVALDARRVPVRAGAAPEGATRLPAPPMGPERPSDAPM